MCGINEGLIVVSYFVTYLTSNCGVVDSPSPSAYASRLLLLMQDM